MYSQEVACCYQSVILLNHLIIHGKAEVRDFLVKTQRSRPISCVVYGFLLCLYRSVIVRGHYERIMHALE